MDAISLWKIHTVNMSYNIFAACTKNHSSMCDSVLHIEEQMIEGRSELTHE